MKTIENMQTSGWMTCGEFTSYLSGARQIIGPHKTSEEVKNLLILAVIEGNMIPFNSHSEHKEEIKRFIVVFSGGCVAGCDYHRLEKAWPPYPFQK